MTTQALCSDVVHHIYSFIDYQTLLYLVKARICRHVSNLIVPYLNSLCLDGVVKLSELLAIFPQHASWPILSGVIISDVPLADIPWAHIRFYDLTIRLTRKLKEPWYLMPLFAYATANPSTKLLIRGQYGIVLAEVHDGYVTHTIPYCAHERKLAFTVKASKVLWSDLDESSDTKERPYITHLWQTGILHLKWMRPMVPSITYLRADALVCIDPREWPRLEEMGPNVAISASSVEAFDHSWKEHPSLRVLNVYPQGSNRFMEWVFTLPYQIRLSVEKCNHDEYQSRYGTHGKVLEVLIVP